MQSSRLFEIIYLLLHKKSVTAGELARRFEVSTRTIYRDIDALSGAGIPVYATKGKGGGIRLMEGYVLNRSLLSQQEQAEIITALQGLSATSYPQADKILEKLSGVFDSRMDSWIAVDFSDWGRVDQERFSILKEAILQRQVVEFDYYSSYGQKTHRQVEPLRLWFKSHNWYLIAFCREKQAQRIFKLGRIKNIAALPERFTRDSLPVQEEPGEKNTDNWVRLALRIQPQMAYRVYDEFDPEYVTHNEDGSFTAYAFLPEDEWVYGFILSFGSHVQVLEPAHIRVIIKERLEKALEFYQDGK